MLKVIWVPVALAAGLTAGMVYRWPLEILAPVLGVLLLLGVLTTVSYFSQRRLKRTSLKLKELAGYFTSRFTGNSSLSIFVVIEGSFGANQPGLREWVRGCSMSRLIFDAWCEGFIGRVESESGVRTLTINTRTYLRELWSLVIHYQEFIEQFYEVAAKTELPQEAASQYNRFVLEYNPFVQRFQDFIGKLRGVDKTEIEPPSVKLAKELQVRQVPVSTPKEERRLPKPDENKGYILGRRPGSSVEAQDGRNQDARLRQWD